VEKFYIWFGKPIWKRTHNGVEYGLGCIPLGGFVALPQMAPMGGAEGEVTSTESLPPISPLDKIIVAFAGPLFSFLLAVVFAFIVYGVGMPDRRIHTTIIGWVAPDMPAAIAGFKPGDEIVAVDGVEEDGAGVAQEGGVAGGDVPGATAAVAGVEAEDTNGLRGAALAYCRAVEAGRVFPYDEKANTRRFTAEIVTWLQTDPSERPQPRPRTAAEERARTLAGLDRAIEAADQREREKQRAY
jgi:membrane-associated protease RseP (regulator of RpoE activity)